MPIAMFYLLKGDYNFNLQVLKREWGSEYRYPFKSFRRIVNTPMPTPPLKHQ